MARLITGLLISVLLSLIAAVVQGQPGWLKDGIDNLVSGAFTETHILYRFPAPIGVRNYTYSFVKGSGGEPAVLLKWNRDAAGWKMINVEYSKTMYQSDADSLQGYYAAGYAEGYFTFFDIFHNYMNQMTVLEEKLIGNHNATDFMQKQFNNMKVYPRDSPRGFQIARIMNQLQGLSDGWNAYYNANLIALRRNVTFPLDMEMLYRLNFESGLGTVIDKFNPAANMTINPEDQHCSAFVKLTNRDLFIGHSTWYGYNTMNRQYKVYNFGNVTVRMSGYPGVIWSTDDFYMTSHMLAITETTNEFTNKSLFKFVQPEHAPEFLRVMSATYLATTPKAWFDYYSTDNSGTDNVQYLVVDMGVARNALEWGQPLPPGTFYVGEQIPGTVRYQDQTDLLNRDKYFASYNIPFYQEIYDISGYSTEGTYNLNDYSTTPRAQQFRRLNMSVVDEISMWYVMRYNDYSNDSAADMLWCQQNGGPYTCPEGRSAALSIASRYDLNKITGPADTNAPDGLWGQVNRALFGAIDSKITTARWMTGGFRAVLQNGPSAVQQPVFDLMSTRRWSPPRPTSCGSASRRGSISRRCSWKTRARTRRRSRHPSVPTGAV
jgi:hypothetical protein